MIPFDFVLKIKFDREFVLKMMQEKWAYSGKVRQSKIEMENDHVTNLRRFSLELNEPKKKTKEQ